MSVVRCPFALKTSTFTVKDSAKTLSLKYVCQLLDSTNLENCFAKSNTLWDIAQKKAIRKRIAFYIRPKNGL